MAEILVLWLVVGSGLLALSLGGRRRLAREQGIGELVLTPPLGGDPDFLATTNLCVALNRLIEQRSQSLQRNRLWLDWLAFIRPGNCRNPGRQAAGLSVHLAPAETSAQKAAERLIVAYWPGVRVEAGRAGGSSDLEASGPVWSGA